MSLYIIDIDQNVSDGAAREHRAGPEPDREKEPARYDAWCRLINEGIEFDDPIPGMRDLVAALVDAGHDVFYVTARGSHLRGATQDWLTYHGFPRLLLIMRAESDKRPSAKFKEAIIQRLQTSDHEAVVILDDDRRGELQEIAYLRGWQFLKSCWKVRPQQEEK